MLKRLSTLEKLSLLIAEFEPRLRNAFAECIRLIVSQVTLRLLVERLERNDIAGAVDALHLEREAFAKLEAEFAAAFEGGGTAQAEDLRLRDPEGNRVVFRFGVRNPEAEAWLRSYSAQLVTRILDDQREGIRAALTEGLARGVNPRTTALSVVGRVNRATGRREGGIIGLTAAQERFVASARVELLSGDPEQLRHYLTRQRRDRRFDALIKGALTAGKPLTAEDAARVTGRYADKLLALRGEMLARTETMVALGKSRDDAMRQAIDSGKVRADLVTKVWRSAGDGRVRHTHRALNADAVAYGGRFQSPSGALLRFPGDPEAPASEIVGCRCTVDYRVDFTAQFLAQAA